MEDDIRDDKGRIKKGRSLTKLNPGEARVLHPYLVGRDTKGRRLPGYRPYEVLPHRLQELKLALVESVGTDQIREVIEELRKLCLPGEHGPQVQLHAIALFFDRVIGKPSAEVFIQSNQTKTNVKVDFSKLPTEKLQQLQTILQEETVIDVTPENIAEAK